MQHNISMMLFSTFALYSYKLFLSYMLFFNLLMSVCNIMSNVTFCIMHIWSMGKHNFGRLCNYLLHGLIDYKVHLTLMIAAFTVSPLQPTFLF